MYKFCPYCGTSLPDGSIFCYECSKKLPTEETKSVISDSVIQRSDIKQNSSGYGNEQSIADTVVARSTILQENSIDAGKTSSSAKEINKIVEELKDSFSKQVIKDSVIQHSIINQRQNIFTKLEIRGFEYLICSNSKCRETLKLTEEQKQIPDIDSIKLVCNKCSTKTSLSKAFDNGQRFLSSLSKKFGEILSKIESGDVRDARIRSYVFQRDVVDYLAEKFLKICQFINPIISTPYDINNPIEKEIEYGLSIYDFIEIIMTDSKLPANPYVKELAGQRQDLLEAKRQSIKLKSVGYLLQGLISLKDLCESVKDHRKVFPQTNNELERCETFFLAASNTCFESSGQFPNEIFFRNFGSFSASFAKYIKAIRLYSNYYFLPTIFKESKDTLSKLSKTGSFKLDQTELSTIFTDPGKDSIRKNAEEDLEKAAMTSSKIIGEWYSDLKSIPSKIENISKQYKSIINQYIQNKRRITNVRGVQIGLGITWIIYLVLLIVGAIPFFIFELNICLLNLIMILGIMGIALLNRVLFIAPKEEENDNLNTQFNKLKNYDSNNMRNDISIRSFHSQKVINNLVEPLTIIENYWQAEIINLGWVSKELNDNLLFKLDNISSEPKPIPQKPPKRLLKITPNDMVVMKNKSNGEDREAIWHSKIDRNKIRSNHDDYQQPAVRQPSQLPVTQPTYQQPAVRQPSQQPVTQHVYTCHTCGYPIEFINQYQSWYCQRCQKYL